MAFNDFLYSLLNSGQDRHPGIGGGMPETVNRLATPQAPAPQNALVGAMQGGGAPAPMPQPQQAETAPQGGGGGFLAGLGNLIQDAIDPQARGRNMTIDWLQKQGLDPGTATLLAGNKPALQKYLLDRSQGQGPTEFDQRAAAARQYGLDPSTPEGRSFILTGKVGGDEAKPTDDMREYEIAKSQGFPGSFMDYMVKMKEAGRNQVNVNTGVKLPTGYQWVDPEDQSKGVQPIAGGPATTIPTEAAGRIGLADSFLENFDSIKKDVLSGQVTGPIDRFRSTNDSSYAGAETYRKIQTGVDALQRMLTGAGMPQSEAAVYAFRYLPSYTDTAQSLATKIERLKGELESVKGSVLRGRGGAESDAPSNAAPSAAPSAPQQTEAPSFTDNKQVFDAIQAGDLKVGDVIILNGKRMRVDP